MAKKSTGRAARAAEVAKERAADIPSEFWDSMFVPFGKMTSRPRKSEAWKSDNWRDRVMRADSPKELGEDFAKEVWPHVPAIYRAFVMRRLEEIKQAKDRRLTKEAKRIGAPKEEYAKLVEYVAKHHDGMSVIAWFGALGEIEQQLAGDYPLEGFKALIEFMGLDAGEVGRDLIRAIAEQHLPAFNEAIRTNFKLVVTNTITGDQFVDALMNLQKQANAHGIVFKNGGDAFVYAEAA